MSEENDIMKYCSCEKPQRMPIGRCYNCYMPMKKIDLAKIMKDENYKVNVLPSHGVTPGDGNE